MTRNQWVKATSSPISLQARDNFRRIRMFEEAQGLIEELSADVGPQLELEDTNEATAQNQKNEKWWIIMG